MDTHDKTQATALVIIKPDAVARKLTPVIMDALVDRGFGFRRAQLTRLTKAEAALLYADLAGKPHYEPQVDFMSSGPVMMLEVDDKGDPATLTKRLRAAIGATMPADRDPNSIRGIWGDPETPRLNCIHGSDSPESAARELALLDHKFHGSAKPA